jgi:hypothetical protein
MDKNRIPNTNMHVRAELSLPVLLWFGINVLFVSFIVFFSIYVVATNRDWSRGIYGPLWFGVVAFVSLVYLIMLSRMPVIVQINNNVLTTKGLRGRRHLRLDEIVSARRTLVMISQGTSIINNVHAIKLTDGNGKSVFINIESLAKPERQEAAAMIFDALIRANIKSNANSDNVWLL